MANLLRPDGLGGCFRCGYVWRPRAGSIRRCPRCKSTLWDVPKLRGISQGNGLGIADVIGPRRDELFIVLRSNKARNPRVFGSVARAEATADSDLDLLVDFDAESSMFDHIRLVRDLQKVFRRKVDVVEPAGLHWLVRPQVLFEAVPL
jgi:uncharacterized protein